MPDEPSVKGVLANVQSKENLEDKNGEGNKTAKLQAADKCSLWWAVVPISFLIVLGGMTMWMGYLTYLYVWSAVSDATYGEREKFK